MDHKSDATSQEGQSSRFKGRASPFQNCQYQGGRQESCKSAWQLSSSPSIRPSHFVTHVFSTRCSNSSSLKRAHQLSPPFDALCDFVKARPNQPGKRGNRAQFIQLRLRRIPKQSQENLAKQVQSPIFYRSAAPVEPNDKSPVQALLVRSEAVQAMRKV